MEHGACQARDFESTSGLASSIPVGLFQGRTLALPQVSASKRSRSKVGEGEDATEARQCASNEVEYNHMPLDRVAFITQAAVGYKSFGISFTANCMRGRSTTVFWVENVTAGSIRGRGTTVFYDVARVAGQNAVLERLEESRLEKIKLQQRDPHANIVVPFESFKASRKNETCTTLGAIKAFLDDQLAGFPVENRVLTVSLSELKRPVKYFWGVHDFVRGVRGAVLGHQYLTSIGALHRDISENNVALARRPGEERGYLIDFDMAILQEPEKPTETVAIVRTKRDGLLDNDRAARFPSPIKSDGVKPVKALRTGTIPYMSFNVLYAERHTHFDDMESFLYVVFLFFFSYGGPLSKEELRIADNQGFTQTVGSGQLAHARGWPSEFAMWSDGPLQRIAKDKDTSLGKEDSGTKLVNSAEVQYCLQKNWESGLHDGIEVLLLSLWT
ncbi:hypothetical protein BDN67DRAFT_976708, partial [Paxillus ammoniavirescens]